MSAIDERLTPLDSTFLELEQADEGAMMHIGGALIFGPQLETGATPSLEQVQELLEERLGALPRFRSRLSDARVHGLQRPDWIEDPGFDLCAHVRHATLPAPGGETELHEWLGDFWSHRLDRSRPLWEMVLVDGLEDGGWMLATKTHHAMVDGVGSIDIGHILLDVEPHPAKRPPTPTANGHSPDGDSSRGPDWFPAKIAAQIAGAAIDAALHPRQVLRAGEAVVAMGQMIWEDEIKAARPSTLNVPIGTTRRFESVGFELAEIKEIKRALGGTVNDVVLATAAGGLRRLLQHRGDDLERPLRAMVPVNLRGEDHGSLGNQVTSLFVELPVGEPDTKRRYELTRASATALKSGSAALGGSTLIQVAGFAPPLLHESISQMLFAPRLFNLTITNVPGPQIPLYAHGAPMRRILPLVPLFADHAIGMAIVSYDGHLVFGVNADHGAAADLDTLTTGMRDEFAALLSLARA